jgi:hypothetical protein
MPQLIYATDEILKEVTKCSDIIDLSDCIDCRDRSVEFDLEHEGEVFTAVAKVDKDMDYREIPATYLNPKEIEVIKNEVRINEVELWGEEGLIEISDTQKAIIEAKFLKMIVI